MDYYAAFIILMFLFLSVLVLRQKLRMDLKRESFELEKNILKDTGIMKRKSIKIKAMVCKHARK